MNVYGIRIETVLDTAPSTVLLQYNTEKKYILNCDVYSRLIDVKGSHYEWIDIASYGQCILNIESQDMYIEIANSIADKNWKYICGQDNNDSWYARNPLKDENIKQAVLKSLYNMSGNYAVLAAESLKQGGFEDITDSEGWMGVLKFRYKLLIMNKVEIPVFLLLDLPKHDNRFLTKGEYNFKTHEDTRKIKFSDR